MIEPIENPYAFPKPNIFSPSGEFIYGEDGMSLRDWFASKAMQGLLSDPTSFWIADKCAETAYQFADAMLAERSKKK